MSNRLSLARGLAAGSAALVALSSCATLNEEECRTADWRKLGLEDGVAGRSATRIEEHRNACSKHGMPVDEPAWRIGWEEGIRAYCTPENGLIEGRQGNFYANSCPPELKAGFEGAYFVAKALHDARAERDTVLRELDSLLSALKGTEKPEDRKKIEIDIDRKRIALMAAERRVRDAEGDYDGYVASAGSGLRRR